MEHMSGASSRGLESMIRADKRRGTDISEEDEQLDSGRPAPIDQDVEEELNAALPEPREEEKERAQSSS
jgi:hypothetical protein